MTEKYTTLGQSTLSGNYTAGSGTMSLTSASSFPSAASFRIQVDPTGGGAVYKVTVISGTTLTVTLETGTDVNVSSGATVTEVMTAGMLDQIRADICQSGLTASRPAAEKAGILYLPTDGLTLSRDDGSALSYWLAPKVGFQPYSGLAWLNQGGASGDNNGGILTLSDPANATNELRVLKKSLTLVGGASTFTCWVVATVYGVDYQRVGILMRESSTGKMTLWTIYGGNASGSVSNLWQLAVNRVTDTAMSGYTNVYLGSGGIHAMFFTFGIWLRIVYDGTNLKYFTSCDGKIWTKQLYTEAATVPFTTAPNEIGIFTQSGNGNVYPAGLSVLSWLEA